MKSWALSAMVLSMVAAAACGGKETTTSSGGTGSGATTGAMTTTTTGSNTTATTGTASTSTGGDPCADATDCTECATPSATDTTCAQCCATANPTSQSKLIAFVVNDCICGAATPCFTACGGMGATPPAVCADPAATVTKECNTCLMGLQQAPDACVVKANNECLADAVCKLLGVCAGDCAG